MWGTLRDFGTLANKEYQNCLSQFNNFFLCLAEATTISAGTSHRPTRGGSTRHVRMPPNNI